MNPTTADVGKQKTNTATKDSDRILYRIGQLAPWRMSVQITDSITTGDHLTLDAGPNTACRKSRADARKQYHRLLKNLYPDGLKSKRVLDCGCGAGGYCFWSRELKSELAFGFDVREHWIKQARFLKFNRKVGINDRLQFKILNLYDLTNEKLFPFDLVLFRGLFFHLPDPINGLKIAADHSRDVLVFSSAMIWGEADGALKALQSNKPQLHGGTSGLNWYPTGPKVCADIIRGLGFEDLVLTKHKQVDARPDRGRIEIIASREPGRLKSLAGDRL